MCWASTLLDTWHILHNLSNDVNDTKQKSTISLKAFRFDSDIMFGSQDLSAQSQAGWLLGTYPVPSTLGQSVHYELTKEIGSSDFWMR